MPQSQYFASVLAHLIPFKVPFLLVIIVVMVLPISRARSDVSGPVCVEDAQTLVVNGKRELQRCVGGTPVRLYGIISPAIGQTCQTEDEQTVRCGRQAATRLLSLVRNKQVNCMGNSVDGSGRVIGVCSVEGQDIARILVHEGWAKAHLDQSLKYLNDHELASTSRKGIWAMSFEDPLAWRKRQNR